MVIDFGVFDDIMLGRQTEGLTMNEGSNKRLTAKEAADQLGYHLNHLYRLLAEEKIEGIKVADRVWLFDQAEVDRIKAQQDEHGRLPRVDRL